MTIRIVLVDDHPVFLEGLAIALGAKSGIQIVGTALTGEVGIAMALEREPDLVVVDYLLPDMTGPEIVSRICVAEPEIVSVVLTASDEEEFLHEAARAGAAAFLRKELSVEALHESLALVMRGYQIWPAGVNVSRPSDSAGDLEEFIARFSLTPGEMDILLQLSSGRSNDAIARSRQVSPQTIKNQTTALYRKLGVSSRVEAVLKAARARVLPD